MNTTANAPQPPPSIVRATVEDVPHVATLFDDYRMFYGQPGDLAGATAFVRARLAAEESVILLARLETAVGFVQLYPAFTSVGMRRVWILNDLFVAPQARGRGVGRDLMLAARDFAVETGAARLQLETMADNRVAQALYESLGYVRDVDAWHYNLAV
jgi:ribosomal protein S18 acetylase RimI-like enzyme